MADDDPRRLNGHRSHRIATGHHLGAGAPARDKDIPVAINPSGHRKDTFLLPG
jgi:hypothetical protein